MRLRSIRRQPHEVRRALLPRRHSLHCVRPPIASIAAAAETLGEASPDETERSELVALVQRQSARMKELIDDLMDLAQIESGAVELVEETVSVSQLLEEAGADLSGGGAGR